MKYIGLNSDSQFVETSDFVNYTLTGKEIDSNVKYPIMLYKGRYICYYNTNSYNPSRIVIFNNEDSLAGDYTIIEDNIDKEAKIFNVNNLIISGNSKVLYDGESLKNYNPPFTEITTYLCFYNNTYYFFNKSGVHYKTTNLFKSDSYESFSFPNITGLADVKDGCFDGVNTCYMVVGNSEYPWHHFVISYNLETTDFSNIGKLPYYGAVSINYLNDKYYIMLRNNFFINNITTGISLTDFAITDDNYCGMKFLESDIINNQLYCRSWNRSTSYIYDVNSNSGKVVNLRSTTQIFNQLDLYVIGENINYTIDASKINNDVYISNPDNSIIVDIEATDDYSINDISTKGNIIMDTSTAKTIEYNGLYNHDAIIVSTIKPLAAGNYIQGKNFVIINKDVEVDINASIVYNGEYIDVNKMGCKYENNIVYVKNDSMTFNLYESNKTINIPLLIKNDVIGLPDDVTEALKDFGDYYEREFNIIKGNHSNYNIDLIKLNNGKYFQYEDGKVVFTSLKGYHTKTIITNFGTVENNVVNIPKSEFNDIINITQVESAGDFDIILYKNKSKENVIHKELELIKTINGNLRAPASLINPSIVIYDENIPNYNYAYIKAFNRYYYITDYINVGLYLYQLNLKCDAKNSWFDKNLNVNQFVVRSSSNYNTGLLDNLMPLKANISIIEEELEPNENKEIDYTHFSDWGVVCNVTKNIDVYNGDRFIGMRKGNGVLPDSILDSFAFYNSGVNTIIFRSMIDFQLFINYLNTHNLPSYFISATLYPFNLLDLNHEGYKNNGIVTGGEISDSLKIDDEIVTLGNNDIKYCKVDTVNYYYFTTHEFNIQNKDFIHLLGKYELYIPYLGWNAFTFNDINNKIDISYSIDLVNNLTVVNVCDLTNNRLLLSRECQMGVGISTTFDNSKALQDKRSAITSDAIVGTGLSLIAGVTATAASATINPVPLVGAGIAAIGKGVSSINKLNQLYKEASATVASGILGDYLPRKVRLKTSLQEMIFDTQQELLEYTNTYGRPLNQVEDISDYKGYIQCDNVHLEIPDATDGEIKEIEADLNTGVIIL